MKKIAFIFLLGLICFQAAKAQMQDTLLFYMKDGGEQIDNKDSADYFLLIMPIDSNSGLYPIKEIYANGKPKLIATSRSKTIYFRAFEGPYISYFSNGKRKSVSNYNNGKLAGIERKYFLNGQLYATEKHDPNSGRITLIECRDSTGNVLSENGNGKWVGFSDDFTKKTAEGIIRDSLEEGDWHEIIDSVECMMHYHKGNIIYVTKPNEEPIYYNPEKESQFTKGGVDGFKRFLAKKVVFPVADRKNGTQGSVIVMFIVEQDGSLSSIKVLRSPSLSMADATIQAIQQSPPWIPGMQNDRPVRVQFTISFAFSLANN